LVAFNLFYRKLALDHLAPTFREVGRRDLEFDVIYTRQHYDYEMSRVFFNKLGLPDPMVKLGVVSGSHEVQTGRMLIRLEKAYRDLEPDVVLVPGDTNSTLAGALAAVKLGVPVAHVEAGEHVGCAGFDVW